MKRVLITGGGHAELPLIKYAKSRGYYVITTGNNPDGLGHKEADKYVQGDFSDKEFVYRLARDEKVDNIISGCNDFAYLSTAYACEKLNLPGHDSYKTACLIHHKDSFRQFTSSLGIRTPKVIRCATLPELTDACNTLSFPIVVKPIDLTGGKGVTVCHNQTEAQEAFENARSVTREAHIIVEEFIVGSNHGTSVVIKNGKVLGGNFDNELYYLNKYLVCGTCAPTDVPYGAILKLCDDIEKIAQGLNLVDGVFHTQFIVMKNGEPIIIDPCRRAPGDLYILFAKHATGIDFPEVFVKAECGEELDDHYQIKYKNIARVCIMTDKRGIFNGINISPELKDNIFDQLIWARPGDQIEDILKYKAGILFMEFESLEEMYDKFNRFNSLVTIDVR